VFDPLSPSEMPLFYVALIHKVLKAFFRNVGPYSSHQRMGTTWWP